MEIPKELEHYVATVGSNIELKRGSAFACKGWIRPNFLTARSKNCGSDPSKAVL
ncbi:hypothetical protein LBBP_01021 [Leptospira borgpetersenii serovar Ballum]|uniref:Uncharacterized protein n=1 Tax=Leptospira borgpetersenii serovar Ballum TaxID=280505 RepID=A0A0S2INS4_LEPBO|nr:hypothetical protein LBBP_01021 [Leptospira borgpetersenii serovar Ballum]